MLGFALLFVSLSFLQAAEQHIAIVSKSEGNVFALKQGATNWIKVKQDDVFSEGDILKTEENSSCEMYLINGTIFEMGSSSRLKIVTLTGTEKKIKQSTLELEMGELFSKVEKGIDYSVKMPQAVCAVRGTEFVAAVSREQSEVAVFDGKVGVSNYERSGKLSRKKIYVKAMQEAHIRLYARPKLFKRLSKKMEARRLKALKEVVRRRKLKKLILKNRKKILKRRKKLILKRNKRLKRKVLRRIKDRQRRKPVPRRK
ncbi:MAG: FecR domain-containing protein [Elusimicrobia bacterium]|nr:FecR domain-containing protein [Elusimicrobiota bacterium]